MKQRNVFIGFVVILLAALGGGYYYNRTQLENGSAQQTEVAEQKTISYEGQDGKTAYGILKENYQVEADESSLGVMVTSINGLKNSDGEYWLYSVNGRQPDVAADKYETKNGDKVLWEYKSM